MKNNNQITGRLFEYKMTKELKKTLLNSDARKNFKGSDQDYLCKYVNEDIGAIGTCVRVLTF